MKAREEARRCVKRRQARTRNNSPRLERVRALSGRMDVRPQRQRAALGTTKTPVHPIAFLETQLDSLSLCLPDPMVGASMCMVAASMRSWSVKNWDMVGGISRRWWNWKADKQEPGKGGSADEKTSAPARLHSSFSSSASSASLHLSILCHARSPLGPGHPPGHSHALPRHLRLPTPSRRPGRGLRGGRQPCRALPGPAGRGRGRRRCGGRCPRLVGSG